jgi:hypothetical protein
VSCRFEPSSSYREESRAQIDTIGDDDQPGQSYRPGQNNQKCDPGAHLAVIMQRFDGYAVLDGGFA